MNVRIVPRGHPNRTDLYSTPMPLLVDCARDDTDVLTLWIMTRGRIVALPLSEVAEILLDDEGAVS